MSAGSPDVVQGAVLDGRYRIGELLGQGGMATVYRAHDEMLGRDVAIKLFPTTPDVEEAERHRAEMRLLARLSHPGLVTLHDAGSALAGGHLPQTYLVMELVDGPTLSTLIGTGPLSATHAARVGRQLAEALATVHDAGVVHRDIKPANVLLVGREVAAVEDPDAALTTGPIVKLADFGIARHADGARLTMTGTTLGTAMYLAPEQAAGRPVGPPADVYALGLVLLECLTGAKPFSGTLVEVASVRLNSDPAIPQELPSAWRALLAEMTSREATERPTMADAAVRLAELATDAPGGADAALSTERFTTELAESTAVLSGPDVLEPGRPPAIPPASLDPERTRAFTAHQVLAARGPLGLPPDDPDDDLPGPDNPATARPVDRRRQTWWSRRPVLLAGAAVVVALLVLGAYLSLSGETPVNPEADPGPATVEYPTVDGPLGDALDALARSVEP